MKMDERNTLSELSTALRTELKAWEKEFALSHNGKKASRHDIKHHPDIAAKYKEYNKTRDILSGKACHATRYPPQPRQTPRKRKHEDEPKEDAKRLQITQTPSKFTLHPWEVDPYDSPSIIRNLFTPTRKTTIGPTPQKDGQALGLFDLLGDDPSPSKTGGHGHVPTQGMIQATPRKPRSDDGAPGSRKSSRTPASITRKLAPATFATPLKKLNPIGLGTRTPSSISKLHFSTPSFLKRNNHKYPLLALSENDDLHLSPDPIRVPRKPLVRGLSSMLAGLRKMEEEAADDDLEALREMEADMVGNAKPIENPVQVEDSQPRFPLGGFDDEAKYDSEPEEVKNPVSRSDGQPLKIYKKKGQKRTTRKSKMKPVRSKPASISKPTIETRDDEVCSASFEQDQTTCATQMDDAEANFMADARNFDSDSQSEYTASDGGTRYRRPNQAKKDKNVNKDGRVKTAARKVTALAGQNFKRLKLRNSGAKGGPGFGSRFRRK